MKVYVEEPVSKPEIPKHDCNSLHNTVHQLQTNQTIINVYWIVEMHEIKEMFQTWNKKTHWIIRMHSHRELANMQSKENSSWGKKSTKLLRVNPTAYLQQFLQQTIDLLLIA